MMILIAGSYCGRPNDAPVLMKKNVTSRQNYLLKPHRGDMLVDETNKICFQAPSGRHVVFKYHPDL
jgi:hypothetical protein